MNNKKLDQTDKKDAGKNRMELIPTSALKSLGAVLTFGAEKYSDNSWKKVEASRYIGALLRHIVRFMDDPLGKDEESGLYHIEHVLCNAAFLNDFVHNRPDLFGVEEDTSNDKSGGMTKGILFTYDGKEIELDDIDSLEDNVDSNQISIKYFRHNDIPEDEREEDEREEDEEYDFINEWDICRV